MTGPTMDAGAVVVRNVFHRLDQALPLLLVAPSAPLCFVDRIVFIEAHGIKKYLFHRRAPGHVRGKDFTKNTEKEEWSVVSCSW